MYICMEIRLLAIDEPTYPDGSDIAYFMLAIEESVSDYDVIVAPEAAFSTKPVLPKEGKDRLVERIRGASEGSSTLVLPGTFLWKDNGQLYNSSPIVSDGRVLKEYFKETTDRQDQYVADTEGLVHITGNNQGGADWNGINVGVEICRDHGMGRLKRWIENFGMRKPVDLHVVLSRGIYYHPPHDMSGEQGSFVLCDGVNGSSDVRRNSRLLQGEHTFFGTRYRL